MPAGQGFERLRLNDVGDGREVIEEADDVDDKGNGDKSGTVDDEAAIGESRIVKGADDDSSPRPGMIIKRWGQLHGFEESSGSCFICFLLTVTPGLD